MKVGDGYPLGFFGPGMHDVVVEELELGERVSLALDDEACGYGSLLDAHMRERGLG